MATLHKLLLSVHGKGLMHVAREQHLGKNDAPSFPRILSNVPSLSDPIACFSLALNLFLIGYHSSSHGRSILFFTYMAFFSFVLSREQSH